MLTSIFVLIASIMVITFWLSSVYLIFFGKSEEDVMFVYGINAIIIMIIIVCILIYVISIK